MTAKFSTGVATLPKVTISLKGAVFNYGPIEGVLEQLQVFAGKAIGSARVVFHGAYALGAQPIVQTRARLKIGSDYVFSGYAVDGPYRTDETTDEVRLVLADEKYALEGKTVGQVGIGTQPKTPAGAATTLGFTDVGFDIVFNAKDRANKDPGATTYDFKGGSTAVFWTLRDCMLFVFKHYVDSAIATCAKTDLGTEYDAVPADFSIVGMTALQAIDAIAQRSGLSWGLKYTSGASTFVNVGKAATKVKGQPVTTATTVTIFDPKKGSVATSADEWTASDITGGWSIRETRDIVQAVSGNVVVETTFSTVDPNPLLVKVSKPVDPEWVVKYAVDVTKYADNRLYGNYSAGARPKPWLRKLATLAAADGASYVLPADIVTTPALLDSPEIEGPIVWLSIDGDPLTARRVAGGMRIDHEACTIEFRAELRLWLDGLDDPAAVSVANWDAVALWVTAATVCEAKRSSEKKGAKALTVSMAAVIDRPDIVPLVRHHSVLPALGGTKTWNGLVTFADVNAEDYVAVASRLDEIAKAGATERGEIEGPLEIVLPFFPVATIGQELSLTGRDWHPAPAFVTEVVYEVDERYETVVRASNVPAAARPGRFLGGRA